jgi:hypothetical protein
VLAPDALEADADAAVTHAIPEEREVAVADLVEDLGREALDRALRQEAT